MEFWFAQGKKEEMKERHEKTLPQQQQELKLVPQRLSYYYRPCWISAPFFLPSFPLPPAFFSHTLRERSPSLFFFSTTSELFQCAEWTREREKKDWLILAKRNCLVEPDSFFLISLYFFPPWNELILDCLPLLLIPLRERERLQAQIAENHHSVAFLENNNIRTYITSGL